MNSVIAKAPAPQDSAVKFEEEFKDITEESDADSDSDGPLPMRRRNRASILIPLAAVNEAKKDESKALSVKKLGKSVGKSMKRLMSLDD